MKVLTKFLPPVEPRLRGLVAAMLAAFTLFGLNLAVTGAVVPKITREFQWNYVEVGVVICAGSVGYFLSTFSCGVLLRHVGPRRVMAGSLLVQATGLALFALTPNVAVNVLVKLLAGAGAGGTEVVVNYAIVRIERTGQSRLMSLTHAAFAVGAILSPIVLEGLIAAGATWQTMYRLMAGLSVVMAFAMRAAPFGRLHDGLEKREEHPPVASLLRRPLLWLSFLIIAVYVGAELGVSQWVAEYYVSVLKTPKAVGSMMVSVLWAGLLAGRLGVSAFYHGTRLIAVLVVLATTATVALLAALLCGSPWAAGAFIALTGVGFSAIYPLVMSLVGLHFEKGQSVAVGFVGAGGAVGALALPFTMAALSDSYGVGPAFYFYVAASALMLVLILALVPLTRRGVRELEQTTTEAQR